MSAQVEGKWHSFSPGKGLPSSETYRVLRGQDRMLWVATDRGIARYDGFDLKVYTTADGLPDNVIIILKKDDHGDLWAIGLNNRLAKYDRDADVWREPEVFQKLLDIGMARPRGLSFSGDTMWIETQSMGAVRVLGEDVTIDSSSIHGVIYQMDVVKKPGFNLVHFREAKSFTSDLATIRIHTPQVDTLMRSRNIYNVLYHSEHFASLDGYLFSLDDMGPSGIHDVGFVVSLTEMDGFLYVGFLKKGLVKMRWDETRFIPVDTLVKGVSPTDLYVDEVTGSMWISTLEQGVLYQTHPMVSSIYQGQIIYAYPFEDRSFMVCKGKEAVSLTYSGGRWVSQFNRAFDQDVKYFYAFADGDSCFGGPNLTRASRDLIRCSGMYWSKRDSRLAAPGSKGSSIFLRKLDGGKMETTRTLSIPTYHASSCLWENDTSLLIGDLKGLWRHHIPMDWDGGFHTFGPNSPHYLTVRDTSLHIGWKQTLLWEQTISVLLSYNESTLLVGTKENGVMLVDREDLSVIKQYKKKLSSPIINCITIDGDGAWVGTSSGLNFIDFSSDKVYGLSNTNALESNEITSVAVIVGHVAVGTKSGLSLLPADIFKDYVPAAPRVRLLSEGGSMVSGKLDYLDMARFGKSGASLVLTAADFTLESEHRFQYSWNDGPWKDYEGAVSLSGLDWGSHIFRARSVDPHGNVSLATSPIAIEVPTPFWARWWFIALSAGGFVALLVLVVRFRERRITRKLELLKKREVETARLELNALQSQMNSHFLFNSLNSVSYYIAMNDAEASSDFLSQFSVLIRQVLDFSKRKVVALSEELEFLQNYIRFEKKRLNIDFDCQIHLDEDVDLSRKIPVLLIQPHIENAVHHGVINLTDRKGEIDLYVSNLGTDRIRFIVADNGVGREKSKAKKSHRSYGMVISNERLDLMSQVMEDTFSMEVEDLVDSFGQPCGTTVTISIKVD